jgi:hypothetical protein
MHPPDNPLDWPLDVFDRVLSHLCVLDPKGIHALPKTVKLRREGEYRAHENRLQKLGLCPVFVKR